MKWGYSVYLHEDVELFREVVFSTSDTLALPIPIIEKDNISKHIKNIFAEGELDEKRNVQNLHIANSDKPVAHYSLDVITY